MTTTTTTTTHGRTLADVFGTVAHVTTAALADDDAVIVTVTTTTTHRVTRAVAAGIVADAAAGVRGCGARGAVLMAHTDAARRNGATTITMHDGTIVAG